MEVKACLYERFVPTIWGNSEKPVEEQIVIELEHLTARDFAELEYTLNDGGIYRKMYDYPRLVRKIKAIHNFSVGKDTVSTGSELLGAASKKAAELLKEIVYHLFYEQPGETEEKN